jgi:WD40 repeat protein/serine/threonine protein kinase
MNERQIFLGVLDLEDAAMRAAYLDKVCAGNPALRQRVEELLQSHAERGSFLEVAALEQLAQNDRLLSFLAPPGAPDSLGRMDHYEVLEVVGRGATGVVLKARDLKLQRVVAIKVLAPRLAASQTARQRFVHEAQAAAAVRDDHVVGIHAVNDESPLPYLVMEYIAGMTLAERIKHDGALKLQEILRIGVQVARGLAAAHAQGLIHRDIKPANILLENSVQRVKITDFGLARTVAEATLEEKDAIAGTPAFMSPEQARGEATDERTDFFSLGSVLYLLCSGRPPFWGDTTAEVLRSVREDAAPPLGELNAEIPAWLCDLIDKLHARDAQARPASAREVADLLSRQLALLQQPPLPLPQPSAPVASVPSAPTVPRRSRMLTARRLTIVLGLLGLVVALTVLAFFLMRRQPEEATPKQEGESFHRKTGPVAPLELRREDIPPTMLALAGGGDPAKAPPELAAVLGDGGFLLPRMGSISWMQQSPDEKTLAVPCDDDVELFEVSTGKYLRRLRGPGGRVVFVGFSRDSQVLAATTWFLSENGFLRVWDLRTDKVLLTVAMPGRKISGATAFSSDGKRLVGEGPERLQVRDASTGKEVQSVPMPGGCGSLCFSPDGRRLAVSIWQDNTVGVFDWNGVKLANSLTLKGHSDHVGTVVYSPDGQWLVSGSRNEFKVWDAKTLREMHTTQTAASQLAFTPDSRTIYAAATVIEASPVHRVTRWDVLTQKELPELSVKVSSAPVLANHCLSRDGKAFFVAQGAGATYVRVIDTDSGKELFPRQAHAAALNVLAISHDGRTLASAGEDQVVKLWELADGRVIHSFALHTQAIWGLAFSPNGDFLAAGSCDCTISLWNVGSGALVRTMLGHSRSPSRIQFSPDGGFLVGGSEGGMIRRWDVFTGKEGSPLQAHTGTVRCVAFSPDGNLLASGGADKRVCVHDLNKGEAQKFEMPGVVHQVAFSPDGRTVAAVSDAPEAVVRLWNLETGKQMTWKGHTGHVHGLTFSPSRPLLATSADDGTVRLWELHAAGPPIRTIGPGPFGGPVRSLAFTPDGRYLCTANANGTVYVLRMETETVTRSSANPFGK